MRRHLFTFCALCWRLSYRLYGFRPPTQPTVGGFWTRLVFLPLVLAFVPVFWTTVVLWPVGLLPLFFIGLMRGLPYGSVLVCAGPSTIAMAVFLFAISKPRWRDNQPDCPQIYRAVTWPIRLVAELNRRYAVACETPLQF